MTTLERPTFRTGKVCYLEMPATDIARSAEFYQRVFGWRIRERGEGTTSFDDTVNEVVRGCSAVHRRPSPVS